MLTSLHPFPLSFLYAYIYTFLSEEKLLFQFYRVVFPCFELIIWGKGVFVASSCSEADPLVKYLWDFLC